MKYEIPPRQVIVLGGGLTKDGQASQETYERALGAVTYARQFDVDRMIFSGGRGYLGEGLAKDIAESDVMIGIAVGNGMGPRLVAHSDRDSGSTFETYLNVRPWLERCETAVLTHAYHAPRALYMGSLAIPEIPLRGYEVFAEHTGKARAPFSERTLRLATKIAMLGVEPGDVHAIRRRNNSLMRAVNTPARLHVLRSTLLRRHTSVQASQEASGHKPADG